MKVRSLIVGLLLASSPALTATDAGPDASLDTGLDSGSASDVGTTADAADGSGDTTVGDGGDASDTGGDTSGETRDVSADPSDADTDGDRTEEDADGDGSAVTRWDFHGRVEVHGGVDRGVRVELSRPSNGGSARQKTTGSDGEFVFRSLPAGQYRVDLSKDGYTEVVETFPLERDRSAHYDLFEDRRVDFRLVVGFGGEPQRPRPDCVTASLEGARDTVEPDAPLAVEGSPAGADGGDAGGARAVWEVSQLGVGVWTLATAPTDAGDDCGAAGVDRYDAVDLPVELRGAEERSSGLTVRVQLPPRDVGPASNAGESGCRTVEGTWPAPAMPTFVLVALIGTARLRSQRGSR